MTAAIATEVEVAPVVLRVADLKPQQHAVCVAVWLAWANYRTISIRELGDTLGYAASVAHGWTNGVNSRGRWPRVGLIEMGFLARERGADKTLRPGPRMAGVQGGKVLELS